eukprot:gene10148-biopygen3476
MTPDIHQTSPRVGKRHRTVGRPIYIRRQPKRDQRKEKCWACVGTAQIEFELQFRPKVQGVVGVGVMSQQKLLRWIAFGLDNDLPGYAQKCCRTPYCRTPYVPYAVLPYAVRAVCRAAVRRTAGYAGYA